VAPRYLVADAVETEPFDWLQRETPALVSKIRFMNFVEEMAPYPLVLVAGSKVECNRVISIVFQPSGGFPNL